MSTYEDYAHLVFLPLQNMCVCFMCIFVVHVRDLMVIIMELHRCYTKCDVQQCLCLSSSTTQVCNSSTLTSMAFVLQDGWSPLHTASFNGRLDIVKTLIEAGANVNQANKVHSTCI